MLVIFLCNISKVKAKVLDSSTGEDFKIKIDCVAFKSTKEKPFVHSPVVLINFKSVREKLIVQKCVRDKKLKTE